MAKHIALVGMMGSGKSTVAPLVAARLMRPVIEVAAWIEEQEEMPISEIFIAKGEAYFRRVEHGLISRLVQTPPAVLSLGGGAFMWEATREMLIAQQKTPHCKQARNPHHRQHNQPAARSNPPPNRLRH